MAECAAMSSSPVGAAIANAGFTLFLSALPLSSTPQGCFMSPLSIIYALSLALNGAGTGSTTQSELLRAISGPASGQQQQQLSEAELNSELGRTMALLNGQCSAPGPGVDGGGSRGAGDNGGGSSPSSEFVLANSIWTARGEQLKADYVERMQALFQATARTAVNGAADVNDWVANATRGMIKELVRSDDFDAILANAIYFKGLWEKAFKKALTAPAPFTTASGERKAVNMMQQEFSSLKGVHKEGAYDAVVLPYKGGAFSAVALLPAPGVQLADALRGWASAGAGAVQAMAPLGKLLLKMPKFKVSSRLSLTPVLQSLGVRAAFSPGAADFSRMADPGLFVSDVLHQAVVDVDEEGTVAAAATAVIMTRSMPMPPPALVFDRPFAFIIYHNPTGLPAFIGAVNDPGAAEPVDGHAK